MLLRTILGKSMFDQRRALVWWAAGVLASVLLTIAFWPSIRDQAEQFQQLLQGMPPALAVFVGDIAAITTPAGYIQSRLFGLLLPILLIVHAIGRGSDAIAGQEERGALEVLLTEPVPRKRVVTQRAAAIAIQSAILGAVAWVALVASDQILAMDIHPLRYGRAVTGAVLLGLALGSIALAIGASTGRRALATGIATALAVASWLLDGLARVTTTLDPFAPFSLFRQYNESSSLLGAVEPWRLLILAAVALIGVGIAVWGFERRDVNVA